MEAVIHRSIVSMRPEKIMSSDKDNQNTSSPSPDEEALKKEAAQQQQRSVELNKTPQSQVTTNPSIKNY